MQPVVANKRMNDEKLLFTLSGVNTSIANSIRRCILSDIDCVVFKTFPHEENKANFLKNTTRHTNEMLKQRLSCVPIHLDVTSPYSSLIVEVNVTNNTDQTIYVTTKDFKIKEKTTEKYISDTERDKIFPPNSITGDYIMFARLRPSGETKKGEGESLIFTAEMDIANAKDDGMFSVASISSYTNTIDAAKLDTAWKAEEAKLTSNAEDALSTAEIATYKQNWQLLDGLRQFKENSFDFVIESVGVFNNEVLILRSCDAMLKKIELLNHEIQTKTVTINKSETTIDNCYDLVLKNEDYSLGKVIEYILHVNYYEGDKILTFCGFKKFHPHDVDSIIRIAFKADEEMASIYDYLIATCNQASQIYEKIKTNFNDATI
tara:strand:+ start:15279 stop:16406 length:1128 start_codon:yes stop_codon:yes gene_type:complete